MAAEQFFYVGTWSDKLYTGTWDGKNLKIVASTTAAGPHPAWIHYDKQKKQLVVGNEVPTEAGRIKIFDIEAANYGLKLKHDISVEGSKGLCHVEVASDGLLLAASYAGGVFATVAGKDYEGQDLLDMRESQVLGPNEVRQEQAHPHMLTERKGYVYGPDLGQDRVFQWKILNSKLQPLKSPFLKLKDGSGPRHIAFHPKLPVAFIANELDSTVTYCTIESDGQLQSKETLSTLPDNVQPEDNGNSEIFTDGKFVYVTNRALNDKGSNSIAIYQFDTVSGLKVVDIVSCGGDFPRWAGLDPSNKYLLVGQQKSNKLSMFARKDDGTIQLLDEADAELPTCVVFV